MLKSFTNLWLLGLKSISKTQKAQSKKLVKSLVAKPVVKRARTKSPGKKAPAAKPDLPLPAARLPGKWMASYYSSFQDDGVLPARRMNYWLYVPAKETTTPLPLVVMLHGCGQTAVQFSQGTRINQVAEENGFAVLYPQQSLSANPNRCWNWYEKSTQEGGGDVKLIVGMIEKIVQKYAMDRTRIYIAGLSAGASMANIVALNFPHLIAAVGMHSGTVFGAGHSRVGAYTVMQTGAARLIDSAIKSVLEQAADFPPMPAILVHGQADTVVRPINLAQSVRQFKMLNRLTPEEERPVTLKSGRKGGSRGPAHSYKMRDHYRGRKLMLRACEINELEHAWSGGDSTLRFNSGMGPDATRLMWDFFARHRRMPV